ncbi:MAG: hypothetical protein ABIJ34_04375 [archaeon]
MKKYLAILALLLLALSAGATYDDMLKTKAELDAKGIPLARFLDMMEEYGYLKQQNKTLAVFSLEEEFANVASQAMRCHDDVLGIKKSLTATIYNYSDEMVSGISSRLSYAETDYKDSKFESCIEKLEPAKRNLLEISAAQFDAADYDIKTLREKASILGLDTKNIDELAGKMTILRKNVLLYDLQIMLQNLEATKKALESIEKLEANAWEAKSGSFKETSFTEMLAEARSYFEIPLYQEIDDLRKRSDVLFESAISAKNLLEDANALQGGLRERDLPSDEKIKLAYEKLQSGEFEEAERLAQVANSQLVDLKSRGIILGTIKQSNESLGDYIRKNYVTLLILIAASLLLWAILRTPIKKAIREKKFSRLKKQEKSLTTLIKNLQEKYYVNKNMSQTSYENELYIYQNDLINVKRQIHMMSKYAKR